MLYFCNLAQAFAKEDFSCLAELDRVYLDRGMKRRRGVTDTFVVVTCVNKSHSLLSCPSCHQYLCTRSEHKYTIIYNTKALQF